MSDVTKVEDITIDDIDDFLGIPGAEIIVTSQQEKDLTPVSDDDDINKIIDEPDPVETEDVVIPLLGEDETEEGVKEKKVRPENFIMKKFIEKGYLMPFEDETKTVDDYTEKDWEELFQVNMEEKSKEMKEQTEKEFFEALPDELKYAATYVANGGNDIKGLLRALSQTEEIKSLDVNNPNHQEHIIRNYLYAKNFGDGNKDLIEEQIEEWAEAGMLNKKAAQFKPMLDQMQEQIVQSKIKQQEEFKKQQLQQKEKYLTNVKDTLSNSELGGVKIDKKRRDMLWDEMTTVKYNSMTGRPTNLLGKLLEDYQFGEKPRYDLIAEALWLLADPDDYKAKIQQVASNKTVEETVKKLKTEESRKQATTGVVVEDASAKRTVKKRNIFARE